MEANVQKQEIYLTRTGGFGGSDAKMLLKIGKKGWQSISETDRLRIAVMLGKRKYTPTATTAAMNIGNQFEAWLAENVFKGIENNALIYSEEKFYCGSKPINFSVFAHADFYDTNVDEIAKADGIDCTIYEAKATNKSWVETAKTYEAQLQWYYMLKPNAEVYLVHVDTKITRHGTDFSGYTLHYIEKDDVIIQQLKDGIATIEQHIKEFEYTDKEEWTENDLLPFEAEAVELMYNRLTEIKKIEAEIDNEKKKLLDLFKQNNVKSLKTDMYQITYVPESITRTFDKSSFFKAHPELAEEAEKYHKNNPKADYLKITIK